MEDRINQTITNHNKGYNCAQAVACAYCDLVGVDEDIMFRMAEGFGLGMGNMEGTCGAVSGAVLLAGLKNSSGDTSLPTTKADTYKLSKEILNKFHEMNGSITCRELKGVDTKKVLRSCSGCIEDAALIVEQILLNE